MKRDYAEEVSRSLLEASGILDRSIARVEGAVGEETFRQYRAIVGQILGIFYIEILRKIYTEYPDLEPDSMR